MKIGDPSGSPRSAGAAQSSPFKKVLGGVKERPGQPKPAAPKAAGPKVAVPGPNAAPAERAPVLTPRPALKKLPGGVAPLKPLAKAVATAKPLPANVRALQAAASARQAARADAHAKAEGLVE